MPIASDVMSQRDENSMRRHLLAICAVANTTHGIARAPIQNGVP
jgi:hypothetical protein